MKKNFQLEPFSTYCYRSPLLPLSFYSNLVQESEVSQKDYLKILEHPFLREAIYLASPELSGQLEKWRHGQITEPKKVERLRYSLLKYITRISSRCTPFGLFAGCATGTFQDETKSIRDSENWLRRTTRFDMSFLHQLQLEILKDENIRQHFLFFPNTTLYKIDAHYRYVEYQYINSRRVHSLEGFYPDHSIEVIIREAKHGKTISDLAKVICDDEVTLEEAMEFVHDLIENQILISEIELTITGSDYFKSLQEKVRKFHPNSDLLHWMHELDIKLNWLDSQEQNSIQDYQEIAELCRHRIPDFKPKFLLQTDSFVDFERQTLSDKLVRPLKEVVQLFSKISTYQGNPKLEEFKKAFRKRFNEAEVSLYQVLDADIGIPYGDKKYDNSDFLSDIPLGSQKGNSVNIQWSWFDTLFQKKLFHSYQKNEHTIQLIDDDFSHIKGQHRFPSTASALVEIIPNNDDEIIFINSFSCASGAFLLGRFAHGDANLYSHVQDIIDFEQDQHRDKILAEIVHLPEARTGNVIQRENQRNYEICYLGNSSLEKDRQILIDDLLVSLKQNRIVLKSKRLNKEIIPKLTNAHNFKGNSLPIYEFLCDVQFQDSPSVFGFYWNRVFLNLPYLPRVVYKNTILSKQAWRVKTADFKNIIEAKALLNSIEDWRNELNLPKWVELVEGDNKLLINLQNKDSVKMLYHEVKKKKSFVLEEFLFDDANQKKEDEFYCNQYVISFKNHQKPKSR